MNPIIYIYICIVGNNRTQEASYRDSPSFPHAFTYSAEMKLQMLMPLEYLRTMYIYIFELRHVCVFAVSDAPYTLLHNFWNTF